MAPATTSFSAGATFPSRACRKMQVAGEEFVDAGISSRTVVGHEQSHHAHYRLRCHILQPHLSLRVRTPCAPCAPVPALSLSAAVRKSNLLLYQGLHALIFFKRAVAETATHLLERCEKGLGSCTLLLARLL